MDVKISGMSCEGCASGIESALREPPGVASARVSFEEKQATISFDPKTVKPEQFAQIVTKAGYELVN